jgi:hypothetical protein
MSTQPTETAGRRALAYGLNEEVPTTANAAWGARWIFPDDMLSDRQDFAGMDTPDGQKLKNWLNGNGKKAGALHKSKIAARKSDLMRSESRVVVLFEDETGIIKGNPRSSHGYLYVCAYLKD